LVNSKSVTFSNFNNDDGDSLFIIFGTAQIPKMSMIKEIPIYDLFFISLNLG
jgi:hypothetical protein